MLEEKNKVFMFCSERLHQFSSNRDAALCVALRYTLPVLVLGVVTVLLARRFFLTTSSVLIGVAVSASTMGVIVIQHLLLRKTSMRRRDRLFEDEVSELRFLRPDAESRVIRNVAMKRVDRRLT